MKINKSIIFLYSRLPDYFYQAIVCFTTRYNINAVIFRLRDDPSTSYTFIETPLVRVYYRDDVDVAKVISEANPAALVLSSWRDKEYREICRQYFSKLPVILALDNPFEGTLKQRVLSVVSKIAIRNICNRAWVPGPSQYQYARNLGYRQQDILFNLYSANTPVFNKAFQESVQRKSAAFPRQIVYVGRLVEYKQPHILAEVFSEINEHCSLQWKLIIAGEGPLKASVIAKKHANVLFRDFIKPTDLPEFYKTAGVFCLPSINEHWGVAVHEAVAAGAPLLLSNTVQSASEFLIDGYNGFAFDATSRSSLKNALNRMMSQSDEELTAMSANSYSLSSRISPDTWAATLNSVIN